MPAADVTDSWVEELKERFHAAHDAEYGHRFERPSRSSTSAPSRSGAWTSCRHSEAGDGDLSRAKTLDQDVVFDVDGKAEPATQRRSTSGSS